MKTLILIDLQRDFLPGGALAVPEGEKIIPIINRILPYFDHVVASKDWHPLHHVSFASSHHKHVGEKIYIHGTWQMLWPDHCVQNHPGAKLAKGLHQERIEKIFYKGDDPSIDSYSAFFDILRKRSTGLQAYLEEKRLSKLYFAGLATDYCVFYSVLDALDLGFEVWVIEDACRAIDPHSQALEIMHKKGAKIIQSSDLFT